MAAATTTNDSGGGGDGSSSSSDNGGSGDDGTAMQCWVGDEQKSTNITTKTITLLNRTSAYCS